MDPEECKEDGDNLFTEKGIGAEITLDLVLQSSAETSENKVNGPEDSIVSEIIKQFPQKKICETVTCFRDRFVELDDAPCSWRIVKLAFLGKPDAAPKKGILSYRALRQRR